MTTIAPGSDEDELYKKHRPSKFGELVGQDDVVDSLRNMGKTGKIPHFILLQGPSGCGKTTISRILKNALKCSDIDFLEKNAASDRGIDMVRAIASQVNVSPMLGENRIWVIDECHALTAEAQDAFLKLLEDTPHHAYFIFLTTDPKKLKSTIITRATVLKLKSLTEKDLIKLVEDVCKKEGRSVESEVAKKIATTAEGSARRALVILHTVLSLESTEKQLAAISTIDEGTPGFNVAQMLMNAKTTWAELAPALKEVNEDPEGVRRIVLGYANSCLLGNGNKKRSVIVIEEFMDNFFDSGKAGLTLACWNVIQSE